MRCILCVDFESRFSWMCYKLLGTPHKKIQRETTSIFHFTRNRLSKTTQLQKFHLLSGIPRKILAWSWFVSDNNPASMAEYFNVVMELLKVTDEAIKNEEYWFFRADVNVVMAWLRVRSNQAASYAICFVDGLGAEARPLCPH